MNGMAALRKVRLLLALASVASRAAVIGCRNSPLIVQRNSAAALRMSTEFSAARWHRERRREILAAHPEEIGALLRSDQELCPGVDGKCSKEEL